MPVVRCPQGHYYDNQRFSSCPHCGIVVGAGKDDNEGKEKETGKKQKALFGWLDRDKTVALFQKKDPESEYNSVSDQTIALEAMPQTDGEDDQKTVGYYSGAKGNDYVTGWLVCISGPEKGRDYRLHHGFNRIGRDAGMDVQVMDDPAITRKNHCSVVYDDRKRRFSVVPSSGALTYYNNGLLTKSELLDTGDEIRMGESTFVFIPFCGEDRVWEREEDI